LVFVSGFALRGTNSKPSQTPGEATWLPVLFKST